MLKRPLPPHCFVVLFIIIFPALISCQSPPIHLGKPVVDRPPVLKPGARLALFTALVRSVGVSRSQGIAWVVRTDDADYQRRTGQLREKLQTGTSLRLIEKKDILANPLVKGGFFPTREPFHANPDGLPIVRTAKEVEFMLRTASDLKADYFALVLLDYDVSKIMTRPAGITARIYFELYSPLVGLVYSLEQETSETALPYDRSMSLRELEKSYQKQMKQAFDRGTDRLLIMFQKKLRRDLKIAPRGVQP